MLRENNMSTSDSEYINKLVELSPIAYDRVRNASAEGLGIRPATLDKIIKDRQKHTDKERPTPYEEIEPWHTPINPNELLNEIATTIKRFIVCQDETIITTTLWIAMTWFIDVIQVAPLAVITAPEKRCGKSQLLFLLDRIVNRPLAASNITSAALFRSIEAWHPTLLIDEADTFMKENDELRGLINCGHTRDTAYLIRVVGDEHTPKQFSLWGAKALAGIGKLSDTIMDRAICLVLRRKKPDENVERLRHAEPGLFTKIAAKLARFTEDYSEQIRFSKPPLPDALHDRAQDNWEPLLAIAETAGNEWPKLARNAAIKISGNTEQSQSIGVELLADIQEIIETKQADRISTADLIAALCNDQEKPWATYNRGQSITPRQLASRLKEFGIMSNTIRIGNTTAKGYLFLQFVDTFERYLETKQSSVTTSQDSNHDDLHVTS